MALHLSSLVVRRVDGGNTANLYLVRKKSGLFKKKIGNKRNGTELFDSYSPRPRDSWRQSSCGSNQESPCEASDKPL